MKGTGAKRNVCPGSCMSTGAKFPVAPVESAPMVGLLSTLCQGITVKLEEVICLALGNHQLDFGQKVVLYIPQLCCNHFVSFYYYFLLQVVPKMIAVACNLTPKSYCIHMMLFNLLQSQSSNTA